VPGRGEGQGPSPTVPTLPPLLPGVSATRYRSGASPAASPTPRAGGRPEEGTQKRGTQKRASDFVPLRVLVNHSEAERPPAHSARRLPAGSRVLSSGHHAFEGSALERAWREHDPHSVAHRAQCPPRELDELPGSRKSRGPRPILIVEGCPLCHVTVGATTAPSA
jgi:hypothetical protein